MHALIFEGEYHGHHLTYLRLIIPAIRALVDRLTIAVPQETLSSEQYHAQLEPLSTQFELDAWFPRASSKPLANGLTRTRQLIESVRRTNPDYVYVPYADGIAQILGAARSLGINLLPKQLPLEGLMMRGAFAYPQPGLFQKLRATTSVNTASRGPWTVMHHLDPIPYSKIKARGGPFAERSSLLPDPVEPPRIMDRILARQSLGIPDDGRYIGLAGSADRRKGADLLIRAFAAAPLRQNDRLLLVGRIADEIRPLLTGEYKSLVDCGRIVAIDRYVTDDQLTAGISAMDLVCTPYPRHIGSASILIRAAAAGRPVLASTFGWMGYVVPRFRLGSLCDVTNPERFAASLSHALDDSAAYQPSSAAQRFVQFHTVANFQSAWTVHLRQHLGLPPATDYRTWEWALGDSEPKVRHTTLSARDQ